MMAYQVLTADNRTLIVDTDSGIQVKVSEVLIKIPENTAYCLATLYRINGGFIPEKVYVFRTAAGTDLVILKRAVDFFFSTVLETALYVKEVPQDSALFAQEALRLYGVQETTSSPGAVRVVCSGPAK